MSLTNLRKMNKQELERMAELKKGEILKLKTEFFRGKSEGNVRQLRKDKKDLARILTLIGEKEKNEK